MSLFVYFQTSVHRNPEVIAISRQEVSYLRHIADAVWRSDGVSVVWDKDRFNHALNPDGNKPIYAEAVKRFRNQLQRDLP